MGRAPCCDKANVKKGPWSPEEDATLKAYIEQYGTGGNWIALPQKVGLKRCGKSCRLRWLNYLRPNIKHGGFSEEEDNIICSLYISIGSRWSIIAAQLPGRTDNDIKNYWNTRLKKKLLGRRKQCISNRQYSSMIQDPKDANDGEDSSVSQALTSSALERLQLHMQLQSLQNPISFYNNPALWPKSHPFQEIMTQSPNPLMQQGQKANFYEPQEFPKMGNPEADVNGLLDSYIVHKAGGGEQSNASVQPVLNFNAELEEFLNNKEDQVAEFDSFKEMNGCKESLIWWANEFDTKSGSSNSWDTTTSVLQSEGMFQDQYELGYNLE